MAPTETKRPGQTARAHGMASNNRYQERLPDLLGQSPRCQHPPSPRSAYRQLWTQRGKYRSKS